MVAPSHQNQTRLLCSSSYGSSITVHSAGSLALRQNQYQSLTGRAIHVPTVASCRRERDQKLLAIIEEAMDLLDSFQIDSERKKEVVGQQRRATD